MVVMLVILFYGDTLFQLDKASYEEKDKPTEHGTILFNAFVWMQIFNEINSRKVHGERNVFKGVFNNYIFVGVVFGTTCAQIILIQFGGYAFSTTGKTLIYILNAQTSYFTYPLFTRPIISSYNCVYC